jgi:hypothetical protein
MEEFSSFRPKKSSPNFVLPFFYSFCPKLLHFVITRNAYLLLKKNSFLSGARVVNNEQQNNFSFAHISNKRLVRHRCLEQLLVAPSLPEEGRGSSPWYTGMAWSCVCVYMPTGFVKKKRCSSKT